MIPIQATRDQSVYRWWSQTLAIVVGYHWKLFATQCQVGSKMLETVLSNPVSRSSDRGHEAAPKTVEPERSVVRLAAERVAKGFAPPREIYDVPLRDQVDWSNFPTWARPSDPELFEGCVHEG